MRIRLKELKRLVRERLFEASSTGDLPAELFQDEDEEEVRKKIRDELESIFDDSSYDEWYDVLDWENLSGKKD